MTEEQRSAIIRYANGERDLRDEAIAAYRDSVRRYGRSHLDALQNFMSEVDNPVPDLALRARYRRQVKQMRLPKLL